MKQNDPKNRRRSAVKLLINLLPDGSRASIWMFAEGTRLLSKTDSVDKEWKEKALWVVNKIHSRGLFTNIENAIQTLLTNQGQAGMRNYLIFLTDGMVDISEDIMQSADSRERIISELIPQLQNRQMSVNAIALSENTDKELLEKLAFDTGGWFEVAESAGHLNKVFLKMFNKAVPQNAVPLLGNKFTIDEHIKEFSVLVFKKPLASPTLLVSPDGKEISTDSAQEHVAWLHDSHYDLITVQQPVAGEWRIKAESDPDNQVMVITDLKFHSNDLPSYIAEQESVDVRVHFTEQGKLIERGDFLQLIEIRLQQTDALSRKSEWNMSPLPGKPGYFHHVLNETLDKGRHTLKIIADGKTFQRELVKTLEVTDAALRVSKTVDNERQQVVLELLPDVALIDPSNMKVEANIHHSNEPIEKIDLQMDKGRWLLPVNMPAKDETIIVNFTVMAETARGEPIIPKVKPVVIDESLVEAILDNQASQTAQSSSKVQTEKRAASIAQLTGIVKPSEKDQVDETPPSQLKDSGLSAEQAHEGNRALVGAIVVVVNLLMGGCGYFLYKVIKKRSEEKQAQLLERLT